MSDSSTNFPRLKYDFEAEPLPSELANYEAIQEALALVKDTPGALLAGGSMVAAINNLHSGKDRQLPIKDVDVFFYKPEAADALAGKLYKAGYRLGPNQVQNCRDFVKAGLPPVQLVETGVFENPQHVLDGFDLIVCQVATDGQTVWYHPQTNVDLQDRELNFHRVHPSTKSTLDHVMRYMAKGFTMSAAAVKSLCEACAKEGLQS